MNRVAFIFSSAPHGSSSGREGLDALLSFSTLSEKVGVFFINDGIFQILTEQKPGIVLAREYAVTFKLLSFCEIKDILICSTSMKERGLTTNVRLVLNAKCVPSHVLRDYLNNYNIILTF